MHFGLRSGVVEPSVSRRWRVVAQCSSSDPIRMGAGAVQLGLLAVRALERVVRVEGETTSAAPTGSAARCSTSRWRSGLFGLTVRDTRWQTGERDVVTCERHDSPERFDTLVGRLRLDVAHHGQPYVELHRHGCARTVAPGLFVPDLGELDGGCGVDVRATLLAHGAIAVGMREELLGEGRTRTRFGALFPEEAELVPMVAYTLTRVAPVALRVEV